MMFDVYSVGFCYMSVCTNIQDRKEIEKRANSEHPTGIRSRWKIADEPFKSGEANPHSCELTDDGHPNKQHWLLSC